MRPCERIEDVLVFFRRALGAEAGACGVCRADGGGFAGAESVHVEGAKGGQRVAECAWGW